ncbi:MAG: hypothetical protein HC912_06195 [Saprospiraceae bacterium]|nr:hypothetical protein [Saprospiraceae bacterium]
MIQAEDLIEQNAISVPQEVEKNLWTANTTEDYEVETQINAVKVMAYSCECPAFVQEGTCAHIIATLLLVRKQVQAKKAAKALQKKSEKLDKKLTIKQLLEEIDNDELKQFIQSYASKDRNFSIALKVRFAGNIEFLDDKQKYLQLLDDAIRVARKKDQYLSHRGTQKLMKVAHELLHQLDTAFVQQHFTTALFIAQSIIEKFTPILRKTHPSSELLAMIEKAFGYLNNVAQAAIAPVLVENLWDYALTESSKITYRINEVVPYFYKLLILLAEQLHQEAELLAFFSDFSVQSAYTEKNYTRLLIAKITLLEKMNRSEEAQQLVTQNTNYPELLLYALQQAKKRNDMAQMKSLAELGLQANFSSFVHHQFVVVRLEIAQTENEQALILSLAENLILQTFEVTHFRLFKKAVIAHCAKDWPNAFQKLLDQLEIAPFSIAKRDFIAQLYAEEQQWEALLGYIKK